jgi:hypothetical protein
MAYYSQPRITRKDILDCISRLGGGRRVSVHTLWSALMTQGHVDYEGFLDQLHMMDGSEIIVTITDDRGYPIELERNLGMEGVQEPEPRKRQERPAQREKDMLDYDIDRFGAQKEAPEKKDKLTGFQTEGIKCPKCEGDTYVSDEEVVKVLENTEPVSVIMRITFVCRSCGEKFTRVLTREVDAKKRQEQQGTPSFPTSLEALRPGMSSGNPRGIDTGDVRFTDNV